MPYTRKIDLRKLLMALSKALDITSSGLTTHHQMVSVISMGIARTIGLSEEEKEKLFYSAIIHDVGVSTSSEKANIMDFDYGGSQHAIVGYKRLSASPILAPYAGIVKHHHDHWDGGTPGGLKGEEIPLESRIIHLADRLAVMIRKDRPVLGQAKGLMDAIGHLSGLAFQPMLVDCLKEMMVKESLLLDITTDFLPGIVEGFAPSRSIEIDVDSLLSIAHVFADVIDQKSPYTRKHSQNVTDVAVWLARKVGFSPNEIKMMEIASLLHDIGKLSVPDEVLDKPGKLSGEEFNIMRGHTYFTYHVLCMVDGLETICEWAAFHHEKLNGNGYPFHLNTDTISIGARIMTVSDIFAALSEDRPYRKAFSNNEIISELEAMAERGELDWKVVGLLKEDVEEIRGLIKKEV